MKRLTLPILLIALSIFLTMSSTPVMARAGGSMGSSSSTSSSSTSSNDTYTNYNGYRGYNNYGNNRLSLLNIVFLGFMGYSFLKSRKRNLQENLVLPETYDELTPELKDSFEPFFYKVEDAWTKNDLKTLQELMSPYYYTKQKRIINGYLRNHKVDHLEGLVIIDLQQVVTNNDEKVQIIVTAQARDFFQYDNKSAEYNQQIADDTNIERFKEIWTLTWKNNSTLQLSNIKTIS